MPDINKPIDFKSINISVDGKEIGKIVDFKPTTPRSKQPTDMKIHDDIEIHDDIVVFSKTTTKQVIGHIIIPKDKKKNVAGQ